jgi:hypothetical protein
MPIGKYFGGHGNEVMSNMTKEYGEKKGKQVFYATSNKKKKKASMAPSKGMMDSMRGNNG